MNRPPLDCTSRSVFGKLPRVFGPGSPGRDPTNSVTVTSSGGQSATVNSYNDKTFAAAGFNFTAGANTYTAVATNVTGHKDTNVVTVTLTSSPSFSYDSNGNLTNDGKRSFEYDEENQLTAIYESGVRRTEFSYDGLRRKRVQKDFSWSGTAWTETNTVTYIYDGMLPIQERHFNPRISTTIPESIVTYTRGSDLSGELQAAGGIGGLLARSEAIDGTVQHAYYHADAGGNVTTMTDAKEAVIARYLYDPFGNQLSSAGPLAEANTMRFSSKELISTWGVYYYGYRFYDPSLQRWLNRDPIGENGGINPYRFLVNDPLNQYDPNGHDNYFNPSAGQNAPPALVITYTPPKNPSQNGNIQVEPENKGLDPFCLFPQAALYGVVNFFPTIVEAAEETIDFIENYGVLGVQGEVGSPVMVSGGLSLSGNGDSSANIGVGAGAGFNVTAGAGLQLQLGNPKGFGFDISCGIGSGLGIGLQLSITQGGVGGQLLGGFGFGAAGGVTMSYTADLK